MFVEGQLNVLAAYHNTTLEIGLFLFILNPVCAHIESLEDISCKESKYVVRCGNFTCLKESLIK